MIDKTVLRILYYVRAEMAREVEDWRDCKDAGEHPAEQLKRTMSTPEPKPIECSEAGYMRQGDKCVAVGCEDYVGNPCHEKIKPGNPDAVEDIIPVEEELPVEELPVEELPVEEELGENTDDIEGNEESGSDDNQKAVKIQAEVKERPPNKK